MTRVLRVRRGVLQTPVITYSHRDTGRMVTLVAMSHIAEAGYYKRLHGLACELEAAGAVVHYEMIDNPSKEEWEAATTEAQRTAFRAVMNERRVRYDAIRQYLGWESQDDAMPYPPTWRNVDMGALEYLDSVGLEAYISDGQEAGRQLAVLGEEQGLILGAGTAVVFRVLSLDRLHLLSRWVTRDAIGDVSLVQRNRHALDNLPADRDAVLLWGADHLTGLAAGLRAAGYRIRSAVWVDTGKLPGVWASARTVWSAARAAHAEAVTSKEGAS